MPTADFHSHSSECEESAAKVSPEPELPRFGRSCATNTRRQPLTHPRQPKFGQLRKRPRATADAADGPRRDEQKLILLLLFGRADQSAYYTPSRLRRRRRRLRWPIRLRRPTGGFIAPPPPAAQLDNAPSGVLSARGAKVTQTEINQKLESIYESSWRPTFAPPPRLRGHQYSPVHSPELAPLGRRLAAAAAAKVHHLPRGVASASKHAPARR